MHVADELEAVFAQIRTVQTLLQWFVLGINDGFQFIAVEVREGPLVRAILPSVEIQHPDSAFVLGMQEANGA